ncbi:MAG: segregation/condensation protein A [Deltaproteobacteria bacterium]|nr:MAG: segregation/condensation protein A [Deltaproteobacteria bacterium]
MNEHSRQAGTEDLPQGGVEAYRVSLPVFEGPLDLLLHLIKKHEIDIFDIPISLILDEYLSYLELMKALNLDVAGEFLLMASELAQIKSRMLLPPESKPEEEEEQEEDPRAELVRRLLDYKRYKDAAEQLRQRPVLGRDTYDRAGTTADVVEDAEPLGEVSVFKLIDAFERVLKKSMKKVTREVVIRRISVVERIRYLAERLSESERLTFEELFESEPSLQLVVATFFALLEMARLKMIRLQQVEDTDKLYISARQKVFELEDLEDELLKELQPDGERASSDGHGGEER